MSEDGGKPQLSKYEARRRQILEEERKRQREELNLSSGDSDQGEEGYISARQRKREREQRRNLLKNVLHSRALTEAQVDENIRRENDELLAAKRRRRDEEKKAEDARKTLLEKHAEKVHKDQEGKEKIPGEEKVPKNVFKDSQARSPCSLYEPNTKSTKFQTPNYKGCPTSKRNSERRRIGYCTMSHKQVHWPQSQRLPRE